MTKYREVLCIGGKHDGRRVRADFYQPTLCLADAPHAVPPVPFYEPVDVISAITRSVYLIEEFRSGNRSFWLARPQDQSQEATFALLIQGYRGV